MNKKIFAVLLAAALCYIQLSGVYAEDITAQVQTQTLGDISFSFPAEAVLTASVNQGSGSNVFSYVDESFSTLTGTYADIYHYVSEQYPEYSSERLEKALPRDEMWTYCGVFDDTWGNYDYVFDYLTHTVNSGSVTYDCQMEEVTLASVPFYKFSFKVTGDMADPPGGVIYLSVYRSNQYTIQFCNFLDFNTALRYAEVFESSVRIAGSESYSFTVFDLTAEDTTKTDIKTALIVFAAVLFIIAIPSYIINTKRFKQ